VDTHVHLPQYPARGRYGADLLDWLNQVIFPLEASFTPHAARLLAPKFFRALLANGTTTAAIYCSVQEESTDAVFHAAEESGVRAIIGKVMMDRNSPETLIESTEASLRASHRLCERWHGKAGGRLRYAFSPRFALSCTRELMRDAAVLARETGAHLQTHISENQTEVEQVHQTFPEAETYTDVYASAGLLTSKTVLAHGVYLSDAERALIKNAGSSIAHCPTSNLFLHSGLMPLRETLAQGVPTGLGSDVAGGPTLSLFSVMRSAVYSDVARSLTACPAGDPITPPTAFYLATLGGAKALGLGDDTGSLEPGKQADFIVVEGAETSDPSELISQLVFTGEELTIERTYVAGRLCYKKSE